MSCRRCRCHCLAVVVVNVVAVVAVVVVLVLAADEILSINLKSLRADQVRANQLPDLLTRGQRETQETKSMNYFFVCVALKKTIKEDLLSF